MYSKCVQVHIYKYIQRYNVHENIQYRLLSITITQFQPSVVPLFRYSTGSRTKYFIFMSEIDKKHFFSYSKKLCKKLT